MLALVTHWWYHSDMTTKSTSHVEIVRLTALGHTPRQIAETLDMTRTNVYRHLQRAGIDPAQRKHTIRRTR